MKTKIVITLAMLALASLTGRAATIGTEFTYQGRLTDATGPLSGAYDFTFTLHLAASGGVPIGTVTNLNTAVSNGLFTATVDFGGGIYNGNAYWISLGVRSNGAGGGFTALTPRQPLTPTPHASYASLAGTVPGGSITSAKLAVDSVSNSALQSNAVTAAKVATGQLVKSLNGLRDDVALSAGSNVTITPSGNTLTIAGSSSWKLGGNSGTTAGADFVGTTDNQALELKVNGVRALRLQPATIAPHVVGGAFSSVAPGLNAVTIGGGQENTVSSSTSTIGGGFRNFIGSGGQDSTIGGGQVNAISNNTAAATVAGGTLNAIGAGSEYAAIGGGRFNRISDGGVQATIGGGRNNLINVNSVAATIAGGTNNLIGSNTASATVGGGENNTAGSPFATVSGGRLNTASGNFLTTVGGGILNTASGSFATVGGGGYNLSSGEGATVPGGLFNVAAGGTSFAAGYHAKANHDGAFVWADATDADFVSTAPNQFMIRASGGVQLHPSTSLYCGGNQLFGTSTLRQMLNLWAGDHGIGVQAWTTYFRTIGGGANGGFAWYQGGVHADSQFDAGGGQTLMSLDSSGLNVSNVKLTVDFNGGIEVGPPLASLATPFIDFHHGVNTAQDFNVRLINDANGQLTCVGNLAYTGQLNKLDVAENFEAHVRAADLFLGHSSRRGTPGRALVDFTDTLHLNFASDWANTYIGGTNVSVCTLTIRGGCDLAEPFQMSGKDLPKGSVVVIDEANPGHLKLSEYAYDTRVAGIISGANGVNTGVTLTQQGVMEGDQNVALSGRVYAQADASSGPIKPGDLLTTSARPGHAMKAADPGKAQGAILGKAMTSLKEGQGLVLVLVTLQ